MTSKESKSKILIAPVVPSAANSRFNGWVMAMPVVSAISRMRPTGAAAACVPDIDAAVAGHIDAVAGAIEERCFKRLAHRHLRALPDRLGVDVHRCGYDARPSVSRHLRETGRRGGSAGQPTRRRADLADDRADVAQDRFPRLGRHASTLEGHRRRAVRQLAVKSFSMALLGWIFIRHVFAAYLAAAQLDSYIAGLLATVVGVLIEVPVMLSVVRIVNRCRRWYEARA